MIAHYNNTSLKFGAPGILLQFAGFFLRGHEEDPNPLGSLVMLIGSGLLIAGLAFYAQAKGRHPAWGLMGLLSIVGLVVLACLEDYAPDGDIPRHSREIPDYRPQWKPMPPREIPTIPLDADDEEKGPSAPPPLPPHGN